MAITITQQPQDYMPVMNPQIFSATSTQIAAANFQYTIDCTDLLSATTKRFMVPQRPDGSLVFDAASFARSFFEDHFIPINEYGFQRSDSIRRILVNVGETYGTPAAYVSGTNVYYYVWNSGVEWLAFPSYDQDTYLYNGSNKVWLSNLLPDQTFDNRSNYMTALTETSGDLPNIHITTFDANGNGVGGSDIANPYVSSTSYLEKYLVIDVGLKGLDNIDAGDVTGDYPIIPDNVAFYDVYTGTVLGGDFEFVKRFYINCEPVYPVYTIHYLNYAGAFETIHFHKRSDTELRKETTTYKKNPNVLSGGVYGYSRSSATERVLSTRRTERLKLNTDWLDEDHVELHKQLLDSPVIYLDLGSEQDYAQVRLVTDTYKVNKRYNEKMFSLSMDFEYSHDNTRQDG